MRLYQLYFFEGELQAEPVTSWGICCRLAQAKSKVEVDFAEMA